MLVDSGADETLIGQRVLERLGVPITDDEFELSGLGGGRTVARAAWVEMSFGAERFRLRTRVMTSPHL